MQGCRRRMFVVEGITSKSEYSEIPMRTLNTLTCSPDIEFMSIPSYLHSADLISENPSSKDKTGEKSLSIHMYVCSLSVPVSVSLCLLVSLSLSEAQHFLWPNSFPCPRLYTPLVYMTYISNIQEPLGLNFQSEGTIQYHAVIQGEWKHAHTFHLGQWFSTGDYFAKVDHLHQALFPFVPQIKHLP